MALPHQLHKFIELDDRWHQLSTISIQMWIGAPCPSPQNPLRRHKRRRARRCRSSQLPSAIDTILCQALGNRQENPSGRKVSTKIRHKSHIHQQTKRRSGRKRVRRICVLSTPCDGLGPKEVFKLDKPCYTPQREHASRTLGKIQSPLTLNLSCGQSSHPQSHARAELK